MSLSYRIQSVRRFPGRINDQAPKASNASKHLLITGVTGFLGGAIVAELLGTEAAPNMSFFVRAKNKIEGLMRVQANLAKFNVDEQKINTLSPGQVICGDFEYLDELEQSTRLTTVTHVINCAALATFSNNPKIRPVNVEPLNKVPVARRLV